MREEPLDGGNATSQVVRVGATVRKPWSRSSPAVAAFMRHVRAAGVPAPEHFGRDAQGRQRLAFVPGDLAEASELSLADLGRVGGLVRAIHDAAASWQPPGDAAWDVLIPAPGTAELVCHNDLAPWNLVVGEQLTFIDWDGAGPSTRAWDLAYAASAFTLNVTDPSTDPNRCANRLSAFVDGYGADASMRATLPDLLVRRPAAMHRHLALAADSGWEPWATMFATGHGDHWRAVAAFAEQHLSLWRATLTGAQRTGPS